MAVVTRDLERRQNVRAPRIDAPQTSRPRLVVVERGSRVVWLVTLLALGLCFLLFFAAMLRTELAKQQLKLDGLNKSLVMARDHYSDLRHERAFLESPGRVSAEAARLGMRPAGAAKFVAVDPDIVVSVMASTGDLADHVAEEASTPLDEFGHIKSEVGATP